MNFHKEHWVDILEEETKVEKDKAESVRQAVKKDQKNISNQPNVMQIFNKLTKYLTGKIVEPTMAGGILASMCKSLVQCYPLQGLQFFIPTLARSILAWRRRGGRWTLDKRRMRSFSSTCSC